MSTNTTDWRREMAAEVLGVTAEDMNAQPLTYVDDYETARDMAHEEEQAGPAPWEYFDEDAATWSPSMAEQDEVTL